MPNPLDAAGRTPEPSEYATISMDRHMTGIWTQRSALRDADVPYLYGKFYSASRFDSLLDGINREITARLTNARRAGTSVYNANTFPPLNSFYAFRYVQNNAEIVRVIADTATGAGLNIYDATAGQISIIMTKSGGANLLPARFLGVGPTLYITDGIDNKKYVNSNLTWHQNTVYSVNSFIIDSNNNVQLAIGSQTASITNIQIQSNVCTLWFSSPLVIPNNVNLTLQNLTTVPALNGTTQTVTLIANGRQINFAFTHANQAFITEAGQATTGNGQSGATIPTFSTTLRGITQDGGLQWENCGNNLQNWSMPGPANAPAVSVIVGAVIPNPNSSPWIYSFSGLNSATGTTSTASPLSLPLSVPAGDCPKIIGTGFPDNPLVDTQFDSIIIWRTAQGQATPIYLDTIPNPGTGNVWTYIDISTDQQLTPQRVAPIANANDPAPNGLTALEYHCGRIWGIVGTDIVYSDPLSTDAFPPLNFIPLPELGIRLFAGVTNQGPTLFVMGTSNLYAIFGTGTTNDPFTPATVYMKHVGFLSYDAITQIGSTFYGMTSKRKVISLDPGAGYIEIGFPIGDQFSNVTTGAGSAITGQLYSPSSTYVTWNEASSGDTAIYVSDGAVGWFRFSPIATPESGYVWSPRAAIIGGTSAVQSIEVSPGQSLLLIGPPGTLGPILFRDDTVNTDWNGGPQPYPSWDVKGNIVLCQSGEVAEIAHIALKSIAIGQRPIVSLLLGELSASTAAPFDVLQQSAADPPILPPSITMFSDRYTAMQNGVCPKCDNFQLKIDYGVQNVPDELLFFSVYGAIHKERRQQ